MLKRVIPILSVICLIPYNGIGIEAAEIEDNLSDSNEYARSVGLISYYSLSISSSGKKILITGLTQCNDEMNSVGFSDIVIEKSSDNSNWSYCCSANNILKDSAGRYSVTNKEVVTVSGGYYYRLNCNHYAKEYGGILGHSESIPNTSNSVYIPS